MIGNLIMCQKIFYLCVIKVSLYCFRIVHDSYLCFLFIYQIKKMYHGRLAIRVKKNNLHLYRNKVTLYWNFIAIKSFQEFLKLNSYR